MTLPEPVERALERCQRVAELDGDLSQIRAHIEAQAGWEDIATQESRNRDYYRGLVVQIGEMFGSAAKTADDGTLAEDVLCAKVPELVEAQAADLARLREALVLADGAMNYMGDILDGMDAVTPEDEEATTPAFNAVRAALTPPEEEGTGRTAIRTTGGHCAWCAEDGKHKIDCPMLRRSPEEGKG